MAPLAFLERCMFHADVVDNLVLAAILALLDEMSVTYVYCGMELDSSTDIPVQVTAYVRRTMLNHRIGLFY